MPTKPIYAKEKSAIKRYGFIEVPVVILYQNTDLFLTSALSE